MTELELSDAVFALTQEARELEAESAESTRQEAQRRELSAYHNKLEAKFAGEEQAEREQERERLLALARHMARSSR